MPPFAQEIKKKKEKKEKKKKKQHAEERKKKGNVLSTKNKQGKKKKIGIGHGHFCLLSSPIFSLQFSLYFREKTFWWVRGENTWTHHLFSFLPTQPNTLKKAFLLIFSPKFFIHLISPPNKHTVSLNF